MSDLAHVKPAAYFLRTVLRVSLSGMTSSLSVKL